MKGLRSGSGNFCRIQQAMLDPGLYIHLPFCRKKCLYCGFVSYENISKPLIDQYLGALAVESAVYNKSKVGSVYVGGGTPSILSQRQIGRLFDIIRSSFAFDAGIETTFEVNPESINRDKLIELKRRGVNRLNIGFQSFNNKYLKMLGRAHSAREALKAYYLAREAGFENINIDLISALPLQKADEFEAELREAVKIGPDHISVYDLTLEETSVLYSMRHHIDAEASADMYDYAYRYLRDSGYERYEISNYAKKHKRCVHNIKYWLNGEYIGLGCAAWSYLGGIRQRNTNDIRQYLEYAENSFFQKHESEMLSNRERRRERLVVGLRMSAGVRYDEEDDILFRGKLSDCEKNGYIKWNKFTVRLTKKGMSVANSILRRLF